MNWRRVVLGSALFLSFAVRDASAQHNFNGSNLREYCKRAEADASKLSDDNHASALICTYYVNGVLDGYRAGVEPAKSLICAPDTATHGQFALIVAKYLDDHPEKVHNPPEFLILDAISIAFPCKK